MTKLREIRKVILTKDEGVVESRNLIPVGSDELWTLLPGDEVLVHAPYLPVHMDYRKHSMAWKGPFVVVKEIAPDAYELAGLAKGTPTVYHRTKLKQYLRTVQERPRLSPAPTPLKFVDGMVEYEVERVLDHREVRGRRQYLLQWKGTPDSSWEWEANLSGCLELLRGYLRRIGEPGRVLPPGLTSEEPRRNSRGSPRTRGPPRTQGQDRPEVDSGGSGTLGQSPDLDPPNEALSTSPRTPSSPLTGSPCGAGAPLVRRVCVRRTSAISVCMCVCPSVCDSVRARVAVRVRQGLALSKEGACVCGGCSAPLALTVAKDTEGFILAHTHATQRGKGKQGDTQHTKPSHIYTALYV